MRKIAVALQCIKFPERQEQHYAARAGAASCNFLQLAFLFDLV